MQNSRSTINPNGQVKQSSLPSSNHNHHHVCQSHSAEGKYIQHDPTNTSITKVYCDACIIQFYHSSTTFLSNLDMSSKPYPKQPIHFLTQMGHNQINNFNYDLPECEKSTNVQSFVVDCQNNCVQRNMQIAAEQEVALQQLQSLSHLNNMYSHNFQYNQPSIQKFKPQVELYSNAQSGSSTEHNFNSYIPPPPSNSQQQTSFNQAGFQNRNLTPSSQQQNCYNTSNQLNLQNLQSQWISSSQSNQRNYSYYQGQEQLNTNQQLKESRSNFPISNFFSTVTVSQQNNYERYLQNQIQKPMKNNYNTAGFETVENEYVQADQLIAAVNSIPSIYNSQTNQSTNQQGICNQPQQNSMIPLSNQIYLNNEEHLNYQMANKQENNLSLSLKQYLPMPINQLAQQTETITLPIIENQIVDQIILQKNGHLLKNKNTELYFDEDINEKKGILCKQSVLKKANQKIKHSSKAQRKVIEIFSRNSQNHIEKQYNENSQLDYDGEEEAQMRIIIDHENQQELYSRKSKEYSQRSQQDVISSKSGRQQQSSSSSSASGLAKNSQQMVTTKYHKEIEKKKYLPYKNPQEQQYLFTSGWYPQSQQLLFEWNNTPLKQISFQSDKIVNESVNVASYVNILSKNRIMIISQNTFSLKYQINLIDLQDNRVICKNQLGQNFQLYPFEPSKLNVQTVKINERLSCIYLMGGSYFKIIKNSTLKNVKRVKQFCIQQILPINKGRQVVALSLNGLIQVYSSTKDRFHLVQTMKIKRESAMSISYVNYFDVDAVNQLIYCCVLSSRSQFIQIFNILTGDIIYSQDIHILQQNYGYSITNMKIFQNHLYIELQLQQDDSNHHLDNHPIQFKVQAYKIDNQSHHLNEFKTYNHSNILKSTFSSKQFFLYNSKKSCIIGFEKLSSNQYKHYLTSPAQLCSTYSSNQQENGNISTSQSIQFPKQDTITTPLGDQEVCQKIFKLNIKQTSPKYRPIFTHIFKEIPHEHLQTSKKRSSPSLFDHFPQFNQQSQNQLQVDDNLSNNTQTVRQDMVLTLFDQNKNVYKIYQN